MIKYHKVWEKKGKTLKGRDRWSNKVTQKRVMAELYYTEILGNVLMMRQQN